MTDELFIQPKCKIAFKSLANGFGASCTKFRTILFREWYRVFHVQGLADLEGVSDRQRGAIRSIDIAGFVRELYFDEALPVRPIHFARLVNLQTISYPFPDPQELVSPGTGLLTDLSSGDLLRSFPCSIQKLEIREASSCSPEVLRSIGLEHLQGVTSLRLSCNSESGAWAPLPHYGAVEGLSKSDRLKRLIGEYIHILTPLKYLKNLSLDVHLTDCTIYSDGHGPVPNPNQFPQFLAPHLPFLQFFFPLPAFFMVPPPPGTQQGQQLAAPLQWHQQLPQFVQVPTNSCDGDNFCTDCWEVRQSGSQRRELLATKLLASSLPRLELVEWTIWFQERGRKMEERRRVAIERGVSRMQSGAEDVSNANPKGLHVEPQIVEAGEDDDNVEGVLGTDENVEPIMCKASKVPLAIYPAVLG